MQQEEQIKRITRLIISFWILMKIISVKLWTKDRNYPLVPLVDMPAMIHYLLFGLFILLAGWLIYKPNSRQVIVALIVTEALTILGDQNRLQPWHYQYLFTLFAVAGNFKSKAKVLQAVSLILVSTYLFSGLQKINPGFINSVWSAQILKRFFHVPVQLASHPIVRYCGYTLPIIEIAGAVGLLFQKTRRAAATVLIAMHVFVLVFLGPLGINYNMVVWPWNVVMIILLHRLFIKESVQLKGAALKGYTNILVAIAWVVLPVFGLFGYWDKYLSSGLYTGKGNAVQFYFESKDAIPAELRTYARYNNNNNSARIVLNDWCIRELGVSPVTEPRVLASIVKQLNERYKLQGAVFVLTEINKNN